MKRHALVLSSLFVLPAGAPSALAHPHVWVDARSEIVLDEASRIVAIRHAWTFDEGFSAFAIQGLDTDADGKLSREELQPLAEVNVTSLGEFRFFTFLRAAGGVIARAREALFGPVLRSGQEGKSVAFASPRDYWLDYDGTLLTLHYSLPLERPLETSAGPVSLEIYDPEYFVAFSLAAEEPVRFAGDSDGCTLEIERSPELDASSAMMLSQIPPETRELPSELASLTAGLANRITIACG